MTTRPAAEATQLIDEILSSKGKSRAELARELGISRQKVQRTLDASPLNSRAEHWPAILDALGLEVVIRPKQP
ncbi:helix-turn-helix domain-containing protein [Deinococcus radiomollis]|uniref:hypothetical protein n=1 Tax=Deinococcus radiomollis TaxID=468916 RepID=UPI003891A158